MPGGTRWCRRRQQRGPGARSAWPGPGSTRAARRGALRDAQAQVGHARESHPADRVEVQHLRVSRRAVRLVERRGCGHPSCRGRLGPRRHGQQERGGRRCDSVHEKWVRPSPPTRDRLLQISTIAYLLRRAQPVKPRSSPGRSRTYVANPDSKSGGPCRQTNRGSVRTTLEFSCCERGFEARRWRSSHLTRR